MPLIIKLVLLGALLYLPLAPDTAAAKSECTLPEQVSTMAIYAERCQMSVVTTNHGGRMSPMVIMLSTGEKKSLPALPMDRDFFARDLSPDCSKLALVSDTLGDGRFSVYIYDLTTEELKKVSREEFQDAGNPLFSPNGSYLAYTSGPRLIVVDPLNLNELKDFNAGAWIFRFVWSEDSKAVFYRDSDSALARYTLADSEAVELYRFPAVSYASTFLEVNQNKLYFIADYNSDFSTLYVVDLQTGQVNSYDFGQNADSPSIEGDGRDILGIGFKGKTEWLRYRTAHRYCASFKDGFNTLPCDGVTYSLKPFTDRILAVYSNPVSPISLYSFSGDEPPKDLIGLTRARTDIQVQPTECKSTPGTHFLFRTTADAPSQRLVVWLHGGPHDDVSPRYNPFIANIASAGFDVLALNYPGSTGAGNSYALRGKSEAEMLKIQVPAVDAAVKCFLGSHQNYKNIYLLGVSYGAGIMHHLLARSPEFYKAAIDFSGKTEIAPPAASVKSPLLVIYGDRDSLQQHPVRKALLEEVSPRAVRVVLPNEGHALRAKESNKHACDAIIKFLSTD